MQRPLFVQFGAGNIGRSLAGAIFARAGYDVLFVEAAVELVRALHERRQYRVVVKGDVPLGEPDAYLVERVDGIAAQDAAAVAEAVARAACIGTAVGANALPRVMAAMAPGLLRRREPVSIVLCENLLNAAAAARSALAQVLPADFPLAQRVGLVETSIGKMVPIMPADVRARDPLEVWGEAYSRIIADREAFVGDPPQVPGLDLHDRFGAWVERKLYIHNLGHAVLACEGFLAGHTHIWQAAADPAVAGVAAAAMRATAAALAKRHPQVFGAAELDAHVADLLRRFGNRALGDTVFRVGRDLPRKLAPGDRLIGGLRLVQEQAGEKDPICRGIAAACRFAATDEQGQPFPPDQAFLARIRAEGLRQVLVAHCGLSSPADADALASIENEYRRMLPCERRPAGRLSGTGQPAQFRIE